MLMEDFHTHSAYSDGKNTPEEIVLTAIARGLTRLGISDHSSTSFDPSYCVPPERLTERREVISALKEKYRDKIAVFCGIEQDIDSDFPAVGYDYVIGSVHYLCVNGEYYPVDDTPEKLLQTAEDCFGGDVYALAEAYYRRVGEVAERTGCDLIGHFDLITKFNEKHPLLDTAHPRYVAAWRSAADRLLETGKPFEINTGAMSRGWRTCPYPAADIRAYLSARGARFVLSSDSHSAGTLCWDFENQAAAARAEGLALEPFHVNEREPVVS